MFSRGREIDNAGEGKSLWRCWGQGGRVAEQALLCLHLSPCWSISFSQHQGPSFMGLTCHRDTDTIQSNPPKSQMRKPRPRAAREGPDSQACSFSYSALALPTCPALKLPQVQENVTPSPGGSSSKPPRWTLEPASLGRFY